MVRSGSRQPSWSLRLSAYGELTDAIQKRAEYIYQNTASEDGEVVLRSETEQEIILEIFWDLLRYLLITTIVVMSVVAAP